MTIVDTSVWVQALHGKATVETEWLSNNVKSTPLGITDLIFFEVLQGVRQDHEFHPFRNDLIRFMVRDFGGSELAVNAAENYRALRKQGITIRGVVDCLTATYCIREGHSLLHRDRDFDPFEEHLGLKVIHP